MIFEIHIWKIILIAALLFALAVYQHFKKDY